MPVLRKSASLLPYGNLESGSAILPIFPVSSSKRRIAAAKRRNLSGVFQLDRPAIQLIRNFGDIAQNLTWRFYEDDCGWAVQRNNLAPTAEFATEVQQRCEGGEAADDLFGEAIHLFNTVPIDLSRVALHDTPTAHLWGGFRSALAEIEHRRANQIALAERAVKLHGDEAEMAMVKFKAQCGLDIRAADYGLEGTTPGQVQREIERIQAAAAENRQGMSEFHAAAQQLLVSAINLISRPEIGKMDPDQRNAAVGEMWTLLTVLDVFGRSGAEIRKLAQILEHLANVFRLVAERHGLLPAQRESVERRCREIPALAGQQRCKVIACFKTVKYPFSHARGQFAIAKLLRDFSLERPLQGQTGKIAAGYYALGCRTLHQLADIHTRVLGRLAALCREAEAMDGQGAARQLAQAA